MKTLKLALGDNSWVMFKSCAISLLSASFGLTKYLKVGPCKCISKGGLLGGILTCRFITAFLSVFFSLPFKVILLADYMAQTRGAFTGSNTEDSAPVNSTGSNTTDSTYHLHLSLDTPVSSTILIFLILVPFISQLLMPLILLAITIGCNKRLVKTIVTYPALLLLPIYTFFSFGPRSLRKCWGQRQEEYKQNQIMLSKKWTMVNVVLTVIQLIGTIYMYYLELAKNTAGFTEEQRSEVELSSTGFGFALFSFMLPVLLTWKVFCLDGSCCCNSCSNKCHYYDLVCWCCGCGEDYLEYQCMEIQNTQENVSEFLFTIRRRHRQCGDDIELESVHDASIIHNED